MEIRPYLTYKGNCQEALDLYVKAFKGEAGGTMRGKDLPNASDLPENQKEWIVQTALMLGDNFIRMSDCFGPLNDPESERVSIAVEGTEEMVRHAFPILAEEGRIGIPLGPTFFSPCHGVVFDKFGVMWNFVAQDKKE